MLRSSNEASRVSNQEHVDQLLKAVTYQLTTILVGIQQTIRHSEEEIREYKTPQKLVELAAEGRVPTHMLKRFFFIDSQGRVVANGMRENKEVTQANLADRPYFRTHLDKPGKDTRMGRPFRGLTGVELIPVSQAVYGKDGELMGVLVAMIDVEALKRIWVDIGFRPNDSIELTGEDDSWSENPIADSASGPSLVWSRSLPGWPIRVTAVLDQATIDRHNLPAKRAIIISAIAGSLIVALFCLLLANRVRQAATQAVAAEAMRVRMIAALNAVPVEFIEFDRERCLILANQAARDASPWRVPGAVIAKTIDDVMASNIAHFQTEDTAPAWKAWAEQMIRDFDRGNTSDCYWPDGQWRRSYVRDMPSGGKVVVRLDMTELKHRDEQLAVELERFNSVFQSTGAGILLLDSRAWVVLANQFVLDTNCTTAAQVIGRPYSELVPNGLDPVVVERWRSASGTQRLKPVEFERVIDGDGARRIMKVTANPIQDEAGRLRYIVIIGVDDTERRQAEIRLFDSSRLANLGEMATGMAHEINQPLAVIRMAADSLLEEFEATEAASIPAELAELVKAKLARISSQTERASDLVNELRAVARKPTNDLLPFDVAKAARVGGDLLHEQLRAARIELTVDLPPPGLMVLGEASRLQQVIINLALNARDALLEDPSRSSTGTLGHIVLRVAAAPAGGAILTIEDDGPGIPVHVLPRLFEPFFTTKPTGKGTGLGLSISYDIVKRMGGGITAENRPEGGARFTVILPPVGPVGEA